jgi:hypothetical protein
VLAVVLQRAETSAGIRTPAQLASAFDTAYWWSLGIAMLALIPCVVLLRAERPGKRAPVPTAAESGVEPLGA